MRAEQLAIQGGQGMRAEQLVVQLSAGHDVKYDRGLARPVATREKITTAIHTIKWTSILESPRPARSCLGAHCFCRFFGR